MPKLNNETNIVETLRLKTEKSDMKQYLKNIWGGYTKDSVLEYLNILRKQQQTTAETFSLNQQALFEEKERIKKSNDTLEARLGQVETQYKNLSESLRSHELEDEGDSSPDIVALKSSISLLEEDLNKSSIEKSQLEQKIEQQSSMIKDISLKLDQSGQEKLALKEMIKAEMLESKKQRSTVLQLSGTMKEKNEEIKFLTSLVSDGQLAILSEKICDLTQQLKTQTEVLANCNLESSSKSDAIETLTQENDTLRQDIAHLTKSLEEVHGQNDKLMLSYQSLSDQLENQYRSSLTLIKEKSHLTADKLTAVRKLDEANSKIVLLELQLQKQLGSQEMDALFQSAYKAEVTQSSVAL